MRFGDNFLDELKSRLRPSDIIGRHVKLKRQGREFVGLSPFTNEKTPSFFVNDDKGFYHCFSSGKHGDAISFLMEIEGLSFPESVEKLAEFVGMELPKRDPDAEKRAERRQKAINWMDAAQVFFSRALFQKQGEGARAYLAQRGVGDEQIRQFGLGYAPDSFDALKSGLLQQGADIRVLIETGLLIEPDDSSRAPWDRFRHRIMFPIKDVKGRIIAFGGRAMDPSAKAKYLNSPDTPLFHKGRILYNYSEARKSIAAPHNPARGLIVAEGYMDVIALSQAGFSHAVAPLGTALTEEQLELCWRAGAEPTLCFDGDKAGLRAAYRSIDRALPTLKPGQTLRFALMPEGKDPDDLIREGGVPAMGKVLERSVPLVDMLWQRERNLEPLDTPEARAGLKGRIFKALGEIEHKEVRRQYQTELLSRFDAEYGRKSTKSRGIKSTKFLSELDKQDMRPESMRQQRERRIIGAVIEWPELLNHIDQAFLALKFQSSDANQLQTAILSYLQSRKAVEKAALHAHIEAQGLERLLRDLRRERLLFIAGMGGSDASLDIRVARWQDEANALLGETQQDSARDDIRSRIADTIREDNAEALKRLQRASRVRNRK